MKKEKYITPKMEITEFDTEDIITTSNLSEDDDTINYPIISI